jgi:hypothetical protein
MPNPSTSEFREWCRLARRLWPTEHPVRVRRRPMDTCGTCWDMGDHWLIEIDSQGDRQTQSDSLIHEWAHALRDEEETDREQHSDEFWLLYGSMFRAWHRTD